MAFPTLHCFNPAHAPVLITGTSRGLGRALAPRFSAAGWTVGACATNPDAISNRSPPNSARSISPDLRCAQPAEVGAFATQVLERFGPPDLLLKSAAVINLNAPAVGGAAHYNLPREYRALRSHPMRCRHHLRTR